MVRAATWQGRHHTSAKLEPQAVAIFEEALVEGAAISDSAEYAAMLAELSRVYMMTGRSQESIATADRALTLAGSHRLVRPVVEALINKGTSMLQIGHFTEAAATLRGAAAEADRQALWASGLRARNNLLGALGEDDLRESSALMEEIYQLALRVGNRPFVFQAVMLLASDSQSTGDWGKWMGEMDALEEGETVAPFYGAAFANVRATLAALRGDRKGAAALMARANEIISQLDSQMATAAGLMGEAVIASCGGDWEVAARLALEAGKNSNFGHEGPDLAAFAAVAGNLTAELAQAIATLRAWPSPGRLVAAHLAAAEAGQAARDGRWDEARAAYRTALELLRHGSDLLGEARAGLAWGMLAGDRDPEAAAAGAAAEQFFADRGASAVVAAYRAAFVPVGRDAARAAAPALRAAGTEIGSPAARP